ncbi:hypothetical protein BCL69_101747 [Nitrosomonas communis]|uniref:Uncharacterized protein n=1 Tax=Nitrosomonas communis TaxID=44574 RepID=A0A0F7KGN7_9PROT|nr:hypothetical protein AAW31_14145 [Nitrosomonas communis]TYP89390.1 hypothetical protein BCL69_101747 [Nitrosomonas communis]
MPSPLNKGDPEKPRKPRELDINFIQNYMLTIGSVGSMYDSGLAASRSQHQNHTKRGSRLAGLWNHYTFMYW